MTSFRKGKSTFFFVEAAVNDDTNRFSALEQVRGMEGEVRHALESNPGNGYRQVAFHL